MKRGASWSDALRDATHADEGADGRALGLHSLAGMLALLVLSFPDARFVRLIARLQIQWIPRESGNDRWILGGNQRWECGASLLSGADPRAKSKLRVDYDRILGADFLECRKKGMRGVLPSCSPLALEGSPDLADLVEVDPAVFGDGETAADNLTIDTANVEARGTHSAHRYDTASVSSSPLPPAPSLHSPVTGHRAETPRTPTDADTTTPKAPRPLIYAALPQVAPSSPSNITQGTLSFAASVFNASTPVGVFAKWACKTSTKRPRSTESETPNKTPRLGDMT